MNGIGIFFKGRTLSSHYWYTALLHWECNLLQLDTAKVMTLSGFISGTMESNLDVTSHRHCFIGVRDAWLAIICHWLTFVVWVGWRAIAISFEAALILPLILIHHLFSLTNTPCCFCFWENPPHVNNKSYLFELYSFLSNWIYFILFGFRWAT